MAAIAFLVLSPDIVIKRHTVSGQRGPYPVVMTDLTYMNVVNLPNPSKAVFANGHHRISVNSRINYALSKPLFVCQESTPK